MQYRHFQFWLAVVVVPPPSRNHRGKGLAAFLKAIGYLIPLMDNESANYYTREVMVILIREFQSPDEEMKKIVLKVHTVLMDFDQSQNPI